MSRRSPKRVKLSYVLREPASGAGDHEHWGWVNALQISAAGDRLFTAGRDSVVRSWDISEASPKHTNAFKGHSDWVNDIALCENVGLMASVSSDRMLKLWSTAEGACIGSFSQHTDYIKAVCYANKTKDLFTAGLDSQIVQWDLGAECKMTKNWDSRHPESIYALAVSEEGRVVASGSVDKTLRLWDPRTDNDFGDYEGHDDVIKTIVMNDNGTKVVTGSSDHTMKLWDIGERRCIASYTMHSDSVWSLKASAGFDRIYSGGREGDVYVTDLTKADVSNASTRLIHEEAPIVRLELDPAEKHIWTSTTNQASVNRWTLPPDIVADAAVQACSIPGRPALTKHKLLSDGVQVLTKNAADEVSVWNIVTGHHLEDLGKIDFDKTVLERLKPQYVKKWCSLDTTLGCLSVHLETDCFSAWTNASVIPGLTPQKDDTINIGGTVVQALLRRFQEATLLEKYRKNNPNDKADDESVKLRLHSEAISSRSSHDYFAMNAEFPIVLTQTTEPQATLAQFTVASAGDPDVTASLLADCPEWVHRCLVRSDKKDPYEKTPLVKLQITVTPLKIVPLQKKKLGTLPHPMKSDITVSIATIADTIAKALNLPISDKVEIYCDGKPLSLESNLGYVKQVIWRKPANVVLEYCGSSELHSS